MGSALGVRPDFGAKLARLRDRFENALELFARKILPVYGTLIIAVAIAYWLDHFTLFGIATITIRLLCVTLPGAWLLLTHVWVNRDTRETPQTNRTYAANVLRKFVALSALVGGILLVGVMNETQLPWGLFLVLCVILMKGVTPQQIYDCAGIMMLSPFLLFIAYRMGLITLLAYGVTVVKVLGEAVVLGACFTFFVLFVVMFIEDAIPEVKSYGYVIAVGVGCFFTVLLLAGRIKRYGSRVRHTQLEAKPLGTPVTDIPIV